MFIWELPDGDITEIESQDAKFLEKDFSYKSKVKFFFFYEIDGLELGTHMTLIEIEEVVPQSSRTSRGILHVGGDIPLHKSS